MRKSQRSGKKKQQRAREQAIGSKDAIRKDMQKPSDVAWGTSPGSMGRVKAESEEARLETCPECGYSAGRHSGMCSKA